ncbi:MAG TPA: DUF3806 domain-containing protein [Candidatus Dormibacteraeota bacterium]|nr:DUF3806 domain-containing protein [Candidatus Dormibacteraeota bacterium]
MKAEDLNPSEVTWVGQMQEAGRVLHEAYVGRLATIPDLQALDALWVRWQSDRDPGRPDPNTVVNALGLCFGQQLVDRLGFRWAAITDEYGTEMGCIAQPGEVTVFPANLTAKRLEKGAEPFFCDFFSQVEARVQSLRRQRPA